MLSQHCCQDNSLLSLAGHMVSPMCAVISMAKWKGSTAERDFKHQPFPCFSSLEMPVFRDCKAEKEAGTEGCGCGWFTHSSRKWTSATIHECPFSDSVIAFFYSKPRTNAEKCFVSEVFLFFKIDPVGLEDVPVVFTVLRYHSWNLLLGHTSTNSSHSIYPTVTKPVQFWIKV